MFEKISVLKFLEGQKLQWFEQKQKSNHKFYNEWNKNQRN